MRNLVILSALLCGCGPAVGGDDPADDDWMLGAFSAIKTLPGEDVQGTMTRFELSPDGQGEVISVGCDEETRPMIWSEIGDGSVVIEYNVEDVSLSVSFGKPTCDVDGFQSFSGERVRAEPGFEASRSPSTLYQSSICPGAYIPGDDCRDDENECDSRGHCTVVWCEEGEPERCDAG
jgi:hypothetical protein